MVMYLVGTQVIIFSINFDLGRTLTYTMLIAIITNTLFTFISELGTRFDRKVVTWKSIMYK